MSPLEFGVTNAISLGMRLPISLMMPVADRSSGGGDTQEPSPGPQATCRPPNATDSAITARPKVVITDI